jgi:hypothetical protein
VNITDRLYNDRLIDLAQRRCFNIQYHGYIKKWSLLFIRYFSIDSDVTSGKKIWRRHLLNSIVGYSNFSLRTKDTNKSQTIGSDHITYNIWTRSQKILHDLNGIGQEQIGDFEQRFQQKSIFADFT